MKEIRERKPEGSLSNELQLHHHRKANDYEGTNQYYLKRERIFFLNGSQTRAQENGDKRCSRESKRGMRNVPHF
jgi:hypothetical protein